jgi:uncharacterized protein related to proFAR isomerase
MTDTEGFQMKNNKIKLEIYEGDPLEGSCCGPRRASEESVEELRRTLIQRNETVKKIEEKFRETIQVSRDIISNRRNSASYPERVRETLSEKGWKALPYIFIDGQLVSTSSFPSYARFLTWLEPKTSSLRKIV